MKSPSTPPFTVTRDRTTNVTPPIPLHSKSPIDWLKAVVHDVIPSGKDHIVTIEIMRRKPGVPNAVFQNESALVRFTINELHAPNVVFDAESLTYIEQRHQQRFKNTSCARLAIGLGMVSEIKIECNSAGNNVSAILVFATYGGGYYAHHSQDIRFAPVKIEESE